jgi:hypothetical protein
VYTVTNTKIIIPTTIIMLKIFINEQKKDVSVAEQCTVVPKKPNIPEPAIPPLPMLDALAIIYL